MTDDLREVLLTLPPAAFTSFARDLETLRVHGAESNTQAIVDAVRERAASVTLRAVPDRQAA